VSPAVSEDDLHAYVDDMLDNARREQVERYLGEHPDKAARVSAFVAQRRALRTALPFPSSTAAAPELNLLRLLEARIGRRQTSWRIAAALALSVGIGLGGASGWFLRGGLPTGRADRAMALLTDQAVASHAVFATDVQHPVEVDAAHRDQLSHWLSNRLNRTLQPPELAQAGYELLGGRLLATEHGGTSALFIYADDKGQRVSVLLRPMAAELTVAETNTQNGRLSVCAWIEKGLGYAVAGSLSEEELDGLADLIRASAQAPS
jgi:anti-sigma factor RsiW